MLTDIHALLVLDHAGWHIVASALQVPDDVQPG